MKIMITFIFLIILSSCGKHEDTSTMDSLEIQIVNALNKKNIKEAETLINQAPKTNDYTYLRAQLHSIKANIDIYSLFPIVKMELFEFAITEWSKIDAYEKHTNNSVTTSVLGEDQEKADVEELEKEKERIKKVETSSITVSMVDVYTYYNKGWDYENNQESSEILPGCSISYRLHSNIFRNLDYSYMYEYAETGSCEELKNKIEKIIDSDLNKERARKIALQQIDNIIKKKIERKKNQKYFKALLSLYQSLSVIKNVPTISSDDEVEIEKSLLSLSQVFDSETNGRLYDNSKKHMGLLAGALILSAIKESVELDKIDEPTDFICNARPVVLITKYNKILLGVRYLHKVLSSTEFYIKNTENLEKLKQYLDEAPEKIDEKDKERIIDDIEDFIEDNC